MVLEKKVLDWLAQQEEAIYLVGGCVRDRLLGRPLHDLDLAVADGGRRLARRLANDFQGAYYALDAERDTGRAILPSDEAGPLVVDVARLRGEDLAADLADRDFTVNALAADVSCPGDVIDRHGGLADLAAGLIRPVSEASIGDDPVRALRAVRQAAQLGFRLAPETEALIRRDGPALVRVSAERIRDEVTVLLSLPEAAPRLAQLDELGLLTAVLPELEPLRDLAQPPPHHLDVLAHSLQTVAELEVLLTWDRSLPDLEMLAPYVPRLQTQLAAELGDTRPRLVSLKLAALLHDVGKPAAQSVDDEGRIRFLGHPKVGTRLVSGALRRLRLNNAEVRLGETVVRHHMRPLLLADQKSISARAVYRFFRDTRETGVEVLLHALADHRATYARAPYAPGVGCPGIGCPGAADERWPRLVALVARMLADYYERYALRVNPPPLVNGRDLLREFELQPGPQIGELLEAVREAQVSGEVRTREEALALVERLQSRIGS
jgi:tRNA nucleotidyltransferase/poly(A) polymerase